MQEIIVDNFAGGGGASTGIELATGRSVDIAINHDPASIAMHRANHPDTEHYCESVWDVDPREVVQGRPVGLVWLSPDCKHFSKAKGGKPVEKGIRGLAWVAIRWAATVKPRVIMLENVEEFKTWGPLLENGYPDPKQKGRTFNSFVNALKRQGYEVETKELRACDYGAPTIRKRLFMVARCDGKPIVWPEPTHGAPDSPEVLSGKLQPWRTAADIIDWSLPCPSIFDSSKSIKKQYGLQAKRPLAENTKRRIARGIQRFVIDNPQPFVMRVNFSGSNHHYCDSVNEPLKTITAKNGWGIVTPYIARIGQTGFGGDRLQYKATDPLTTITTKAEHMLITPVLGVNTSGHLGSAADDPLKTVTTGGHHMLIMPHITKFRGGATGHSVDEPLHTITSGAGSARPAGAAHAMGVVAAFLTQYHTETNHKEVRGQELDKPMLTLDTSNRYGMVTAHIARHFGKSVGSSTDEPIGTVTAGGGGKSALFTSHLVKLRGTCADGQPVTEPMPTITAGGLHIGEVRAFLLKYYGSADNGQQLDEPLHTITTKDRFGLVTVEGVDYQIVDIGMRMLKSYELFTAQGFPEGYIIDTDADGNVYPEDQKVARCGNSVPPLFAKALVRANMPELCIGSGNQLTVERYKEAVGSGQVEFSL